MAAVSARAVRTVKAMYGELQTDFPTTAERFSSNAAAAERRRNYVDGTAARTPLLGAAQEKSRTFSRVFFADLLKSADVPCIAEIDRHCILLSFVLGNKQ